MSISNFILAIIATMVIVTPLSSWAAEPGLKGKQEVQTSVRVSPDYKGRVSDTTFYEWNTYWIKSGIYAYYKVHGEWPASWQHVRNEGFIQIDLISPEGFVIDPDDQSLDFYGDVYYFKEQDYYSNNVRLAELKDVDGLVVDYMDLEPPGSYANTFQWIIDNSEIGQQPELAAYLTEFQLDPLRMKQAGIAKMLYDGIFLFSVINGQLPKDWNEYIDSGFAPITRDSINPVTGQLFRGDGSAGDFLYRYFPADTENSRAEAFEFLHIDPNGSRPLVRFTY